MNTLLKILIWRQCLLSPFPRYCCSKIGRYYDPHKRFQGAKGLNLILKLKHDLLVFSIVATKSFSEQKKDCIAMVSFLQQLHFSPNPLKAIYMKTMYRKTNTILFRSITARKYICHTLWSYCNSKPVLSVPSHHLSRMQSQ